MKMPKKLNFFESSIRNELKNYIQRGKVDLFIDGGISELGLASTIVQVIDGKPQILRQGSISLEEINKIFVENKFH